MNNTQRIDRLEMRINQIAISLNKLNQLRYTQANYVKKLRGTHVKLSRRIGSMSKLSGKDVAKLKKLIKKRTIALNRLKGGNNKYLHYFSMAEKQKLLRLLHPGINGYRKYYKKGE